MAWVSILALKPGCHHSLIDQVWSQVHVVGRPGLNGGLSPNLARERVSHVPSTYESFSLARYLSQGNE